LPEIGSPLFILVYTVIALGSRLQDSSDRDLVLEFHPLSTAKIEIIGMRSLCLDAYERPSSTRRRPGK
jgi:hypothetical protein